MQSSIFIDIIRGRHNIAHQKGVHSKSHATSPKKTTTLLHKTKSTHALQKASSMLLDLSPLMGMYLDY